MSRVLILDTETNGREPAEVIELAYASLTEGLWTPGEVRLERFQPVHPSTFGALCTHNILDSELIGTRPSAEAALRIPIETEYIVGHQVDYDWEALRQPKVKRICTLAIARALYPDDSHKLGALLYRFYADKEEARRTLQEAHSADGDVYILSQVLVAMLADLEHTFSTAEELWTFSEECRIPKIMGFGKHKGMLIADMPYDYKKWCLRQPDFDPYVLQAIRNSL